MFQSAARVPALGIGSAHVSDRVEADEAYELVAQRPMIPRTDGLQAKSSSLASRMPGVLSQPALDMFCCAGPRWWVRSLGWEWSQGLSARP